MQSENAECGKAYQAFQNCAVAACIANCETQEEFDACIADKSLYSDGACSEAIPAVKDACGDDVAKYEAACKDGLPTYINLHCIAPKGVDAGDGG